MIDSARRRDGNLIWVSVFAAAWRNAHKCSRSGLFWPAGAHGYQATCTP
jgi:hypothetical protein